MLKYKIFKAIPGEFNFPFILVYPANFKNYVKIFVEGNNSVDYEKEGQQSFDAQKKCAEDYAISLTVPQDGNCFSMGYLYQLLYQPVVIPIIERCDYEHPNEFYTQMLGRNVVLTKDGKFANLPAQIVKMVEFVQRLFTDMGIVVDQRAGLLGMSTSGVFAGKMLFTEPEKFDACLSICSNAVQPLPLSKYNGIELPYPLGTADYEEIFHKPFNAMAYARARQLFIVGEEEPNIKYNIAKNLRLHNKATQEKYLEVYGDIGIQERQIKIQNILSLNNINNSTCIVAPGGHTLSGKGNIISKAINTFNATSTPNIQKTK